MRCSKYDKAQRARNGTMARRAPTAHSCTQHLACARAAGKRADVARAHRSQSAAVSVVQAQFDRALPTADCSADEAVVERTIASTVCGIF